MNIGRVSECHCQSALWIMNSHLGLCWFFGRFYCKYVKLCVVAFSASRSFSFLVHHLTRISLHDTGLCTVNQLFSLENVCVSKETLIMVIFMWLVGWRIIVGTVYLAYVCNVMKQFVVLKMRRSLTNENRWNQHQQLQYGSLKTMLSRAEAFLLWPSSDWSVWKQTRSDHKMLFCQSGEHHDNIFGNYGILKCKSKKKKQLFCFVF